MPWLTTLYFIVLRSTQKRSPISVQILNQPSTSTDSSEATEYELGSRAPQMGDKSGIRSIRSSTCPSAFSHTSMPQTIKALLPEMIHQNE